MSADSVVAIAWDFLKSCVVVPIGRGFRYVMSSKSFADRLRNEVHNLEIEDRRVRDLAQGARNNVLNLNDPFTEWRKNADKAMEDAGKLLDAFDQASKTCCYGTLPDPYCRYRFSREAEAEIEVVQKIARDCIRFRALDDICLIGPAPADPTPARKEGKDAIPSTSRTASISSASTFESRDLMIQKIMEALASKSNSAVGVYGMGGLGKSTLLEEVETMLREKKSFDCVAKADVSENPDIKTIQGEIANGLGLTRIKEEETVSGRAKLLRQRLEDEERQEQKVLIILDNLWKGLDLKSVGIPCGLDNKVKGCQLLLTSRDGSVLREEMGCDEAFQLCELEKAEAKILFERIGGDRVHEDDFKALVDKALDICAGVPFLIVAMAKRFKVASLPQWKDTVKKIEEFTDKRINNLIDKMLQWSYDKLEDEVKSLLRLCVVYGVSKPSLQNLVKYGVGLGIFERVGSMEEVRNRLSSHIRTLQASSLLLDSEDVASFKIHDLVRQFVVSVTSNDHPLLVLKDKDKLITELPKDRLNSYRAMCFPYVDMERLPEELDCSELQIFLLFTYNKFLHVPDSLFNSMGKLTVLNLTGMRLTQSSLSFQLLKNLHTLCLDDCWLEDVTIIGKATRLQILSLVGSNIRQLPKEIGQLVDLRLLDLSRCLQLEIIEPGVLGRLIKLEELYMNLSFDLWNAVEQTPPTNASLIELNNMKSLSTLHLSISNLGALPGDLSVEKLNEYRIQIGFVNWRRRKCKGSTALELNLKPISDVLQKGCIQSILEKTDDLLLSGLDALVQSICVLSQKGFPRLKHLNVEHSPSVRYIIERSSLPAFKKLETLFLCDLVNLEKICPSHISITSFNTLKVVRVISCDKMEVLFPLSVIRGLPQLEEIEVAHCKLIRGIVEVDDRGKLEFPKLLVLKLRDLPNIKSFFTDGSTSPSRTSDDQVGTQIAFFDGQQVSVPSLESLTMEGLPSLEEIWSDESPLELSNLQSIEVKQCQSLLKVISFRLLMNLQKLRTLTVNKCVLMQEIFYHDGLSGSGNYTTPFEPTTFSLEELGVYSCDNLRFMFFPSMFKTLAQLRDLSVSRCKKMEAIIMEEERLGLEKSETLAIPRLTNLRLEQLETLICFYCRKSSQEAQSQNLVQSHSTALFNREVSIPSLESLTMRGLPNLKEIWSDESPLELELSNLQSIEVDRCQSLSKVINFKSLMNLQKLHILTVKNCISMQEIFYQEGLSGSGNYTTLFEPSTFSLEKLAVANCNNLRFMFFPSMLKTLAQLRNLSVSRCKKMEAIIMEEEQLGVETSETLAFPRLTKLRLELLESLICFYRGKSSQEAQSHNLVQSRSTTLFNREVSIPSLESLTMRGLPNLKEIWSDESPLELELSNLQSIEVDGCQSLTKVISFRSLMNLQKLHTLTVKNCVSMQDIFYQEGVSSSGNYTTLFEPSTFSLEKLAVANCNNLRFMFFPSMLKTLAQLRDLSVSRCKKMEAIIMEEERLGLETSETLAFPMLTNLRLEQLESLICFYRGKSSQEAQSHNLVQSRSTALFNREVVFPRLEELEISGMNIIERIMGNQVAVDCFQNLKSLRLCGCNKLKCVWDKELHHQVKFRCLRFLSISSCESLTFLFPASVARDLTQLEELEIDKCGIVELIEKEEGLIPGVVLPKLTSLKLKYLTELKCTYTGLHGLHWPALKTLEVHGCTKMELLASQPENEMSLHKQPVFLIEKGGFPNLQELKLDLSKRMEIWNGHFQNEEFFRKLRVLELRHISNDSAISACHFIECVTNLEELVVCQSYQEEPSNNVEAMEGPRHVQKVILPFSKHVQHLKTLDISYCDGLSNIFTPTIAEYLGALTKLKISNCRMLREVISDEAGKEGRVVAFNQLKYLELDGLMGLRCFSSGDYTLMFPLLEHVIVSECPNMKIFSKGPIEASKVERVKVSEKEWFWTENLNITVQYMFEEMGTLIGVKSMWLSEFPHLIGKWHRELGPVKSSWQLQSLVVDRCPSFVNAISSNLLLALDSLWVLQVRDCESLEEIFDMEGLKAMESTRVLPYLWELTLVNLPKLRRLWNKNLQESLRLKFLSRLILYNCSVLRHAFTPSMVRCLPKLWWIEIKECGEMEGVIADEEGPGSAVEKIAFPNLRTIELKRLPNLTSFLLGKNHMLECPELEELTIAHCPKMKCLTRGSWMEIDEGTPSLFTPQVQFPLLKSMALSHMDNLSKIWTDNPQENLTFDYLEKVEAQHCKSLVNLFSYWMATSLNQIKELRVESCGMEEIVASGDDIPRTNTSQVLFPKLTSLVLHDMPQLKSFCPNLPTLNWPLMEELRMTHCNRLCLAASMNNWAQKDDQQYLLDQEAHSSFERGFPNIERLLLVEKDIQMIEDGKFPDDIFGKPKVVTLACFHDKKAVFPPRSFLERFQNMQSIEIFCCSFEDIFPDEELVDKGKHSVLESLGQLKLSKLHNLKRVWREDSLVSKILQSIKTFEVWDCPGLTTLFPTVTSFQNMTKLVVKNSSGLVNLITVSVIMNLVHLADMTIIGCERMKEVVENDENREGKVISFRKLERLTLQQLPSLECFSSTTSCSFRFPSLLKIIVEECPKIKIFSKGMLSTPKLRYMRLFGYEWQRYREGDGDVNTIIQKLSA